MTARTVVFWNVQRLFAEEGSPVEEVLRSGARREPPDAIHNKILTIGSVIDHIATSIAPPILVGLVEVQTAALARRICQAITGPALTDVDTTADDQLGFSLTEMNITLLYDPAAADGVTRLRSHIVDRTFETRDILEVTLTRPDGTELAVLVNHWPSRLSSEGTAKRIAAAHYVAGLTTPVVRYSLDEMWDPHGRVLDIPPKDDLIARARRPLIIMGDFNDEPFDRSLEILGATSDPEKVADDLAVRGRSRRDRFSSYIASTPRLYNPFWGYVTGRTGSYYRSPRWRTYDQILLSRAFVEPKDTYPAYQPGSAALIQPATVTRNDRTVVDLVNRNGKPASYDHDDGSGCSDHFPVTVTIEWQ